MCPILRAKEDPRGANGNPEKPTKNGKSVELPNCDGSSIFQMNPQDGFGSILRRQGSSRRNILRPSPELDAARCKNGYDPLTNVMALSGGGFFPQ
jgi:hypothetical protein